MKGNNLYIVFPYLLLLTASYFIIPWHKNQTVLEVDNHNLKINLDASISNYTFVYRGKNDKEYMQFRLASGLHTNYPDTLTIRFSQRELLTVSKRDKYDQKLVMNLGFVEYYNGDKWKALYPNLGEKEHFIVPFSIVYEDFENIQDNILMQCLPMGLRTDEEGNETSPIRKWNK